MTDKNDEPVPAAGTADHGPDHDEDKLKQAMEHKKQQSWHGVGGSGHRDSGKGKGDSHRAGGSRQFRRKSG
jgi:hypothetical protein